MILIYPSLITLGAIILIGKMHPFKYFLIFIFAFFAFYTFDCYACEHNPKNEYTNGKLSESARDDYFNAATKSSQAGFRYLNMANETSIAFPEIAAGDISKDLMKALVTSLPMTDCKSKLIISFLTVFASYLEHVFDEWEDFNYYLYMSKYNFEMSEFYQDVLFYDSFK